MSKHYCTTMVGMSGVFTENVRKHLPINLTDKLNEQDHIVPSWIERKIQNLLDQLARAGEPVRNNITALRRVNYYDDQQDGQYNLLEGFPIEPTILVFNLSNDNTYKGGQFVGNGEALVLRRGWVAVLTKGTPFHFEPVTEGVLETMQVCVY